MEIEATDDSRGGSSANTSDIGIRNQRFDDGIVTMRGPPVAKIDDLAILLAARRRQFQKKGNEVFRRRQR